MIEIAFILVAAAIGHGIAKWLRLPTIPVLLAAGYGLSLLFFAPKREASLDMAQFGLAFLVFVAGTELNLKRCLHQGRQVVWVAILQFVVIGCATYLVAHLLGYAPLKSLYIGTAVSASSTYVVIRHLRKQQLMFQPFGRIVTGVLLLQDLMLFVILVLLTTLPEGWHQVAWGLGGVAFIALLAIGLSLSLLPWLARKLDTDNEALLLLGFTTLFLFLGLASLLNSLPIVGAFFAGVALSSFPINGLLRGLLGSMTEFFHALFFTALGTLLIIPGFYILWEAFLLAAVVLLITPPLVTFVAESLGQSARSGLETGLLLAQSSELGIILGMVGIAQGAIGHDAFSLIVLVAVISMTITSRLATDSITWRLLRFHPGRRGEVTTPGLKDHVIILGFGSSGMWDVQHLIASGHSLIVIDEDPSVISRLEQNQVSCMRGDGSDERVLIQADAKHARLVIVSLPRVSDIVNVIKYVKPVPVIARVFERSDALLIEKAGGKAILNSEATAQEFLRWFDTQKNSDV